MKNKDDIPEVKITSTPIKAITKKLSAMWTLDIPKTIEFNNQYFEICEENEWLANEIIDADICNTGVKRKVFLNIKHEDEGIALLARAKLGLKVNPNSMKEIYGLDIERVITDQLAREIRNEVDKELIEKMKELATDSKTLGEQNAKE